MSSRWDVVSGSGQSPSIKGFAERQRGILPEFPLITTTKIREYDKSPPVLFRKRGVSVLPVGGRSPRGAEGEDGHHATQRKPTLLTKSSTGIYPFSGAARQARP